MSKEEITKVVDFLTGKHSAIFQVKVKRGTGGHSIQVTLNHRTNPNLGKLMRAIERNHGRLPYEHGKHFYAPMPWGRISVLRNISIRSKPPEVYIRIDGEHRKIFDQICKERGLKFRER